MNISLYVLHSCPNVGYIFLFDLIGNYNICILVSPLSYICQKFPLDFRQSSFFLNSCCIKSTHEFSDIFSQLQLFEHFMSLRSTSFWINFSHLSNLQYLLASLSQCPFHLKAWTHFTPWWPISFLIISNNFFEC